MFVRFLPAHRRRGTAAGIVLPFAFVAVLTAFHFTTKSPTSSETNPSPLNRPENRVLTFSQRVAYQRAIEEVYWQHRIWPKERTDSRPPLETVTSPRQIEKKVRDYLRNSR